ASSSPSFHRTSRSHELRLAPLVVRVLRLYPSAFPRAVTARALLRDDPLESELADAREERVSVLERLRRRPSRAVETQADEQVATLRVRPLADVGAVDAEEVEGDERHRDGEVVVEHPPAKVREPRFPSFPGDEFPVEHETLRELAHLRQDRRHV